MYYFSVVNLLFVFSDGNREWENVVFISLYPPNNRQFWCIFIFGCYQSGTIYTFTKNIKCPHKGLAPNEKKNNKLLNLKNIVVSVEQFTICFYLKISPSGVSESIVCPLHNSHIHRWSTNSGTASTNPRLSKERMCTRPHHEFNHRIAHIIN